MTPAPKRPRGAASKAKPATAAAKRRTGPQVRGKATVSRAAWKRPTRDRVTRLRGRLRGVYGIPVERPHHDPIGELILTVLSQSTNDRNRDIAYLSLTSRFPDWEEVRDAPVELVEEAIRRGGISKVKSARIKAILEAIGDPLSLEHLAELPLKEAQDELCALPGVGRKTAACVLLFSFGMDDIPVDTHVSRVGTRLGLFRPGAPLEELHDAMLDLTPTGAAWEFHVNLLRHGRRTCAAQRPECASCALRSLCPRIAVDD
ncbi:MAG: DNA lyase [Solirubrobacteraceae bacterium]|nr:helix-hairpin-helix domain-containing protein [Patulibacter sp.]